MLMVKLVSGSGKGIEEESAVSAAMLHGVLVENKVLQALGYNPGCNCESNDDPSPHVSIMFNGPATIVSWKDGTKTVAVCHEPDSHDPVLGFLIAFFKTVSPFTKTQTQKFLNTIWDAKPVVFVDSDDFETYTDKMEFLEWIYMSETESSRDEANVVFAKVRRVYKGYVKAMSRKKAKAGLQKSDQDTK